MTQMFYADQVGCSDVFRLKQNTVSMSKENEKAIYTQELKKKRTKPPDLTQNMQQTQSSTHKASDKRSRSVNFKWRRKRCVWAQVQFRQCKLSSPLLIRRTCHSENHSLILSQYKSAYCRFTHLVQLKIGNAIFFETIHFLL